MNDTKIITLGKGDYGVAMSHRTSDGCPCLTIRKLSKPESVGTLLEPGASKYADEYDVIIDVLTPEAAAVLLVTAQSIAFAHGLET